MNDAEMNEGVDCTQARMHFALLLYGELSFDEEERVETHLDGCVDCRATLDRQKALHAAFDGLAVEPPPSLLRECRADLAAALRHGADAKPAAHGKPLGYGWWDRFVDFLSDGPMLRPIGAFALVLLGFAGAKLMPNLGEKLFAGSILGSANQAGIIRVSDIEPQADGNVRIVLDETRRRTVSGGVDDPSIKNYLLEAVRDSSNQGLRSYSVDLLTRRAQSPDIRGALVFVVVNDQNDGVRLKAMEGLREFAAYPEVRKAFTRVLLSDANPGVRTHAIDLLTQGPGVAAGPGETLPTVDPANVDRATIGMLQQMMSQEKNASVRHACEKVLELMNASPEAY